jgi:hypothetical protein
MTMAIHGGLSPEDIIAFIREHTDTYAQQIKGEMQAAQDRTQLVKDLADFAARLEDYKTRKDWSGLSRAIEAFMNAHPALTWGGKPHDMGLWLKQADAWACHRTIRYGTYSQQNHPDAKDARTSFTFQQEADAEWDDDVEAAVQTMVTSWIQEMNNWKDQISSDDKIGMMKLQDDADRLKNLYELGSSLVAKVNGCASSIIANIGRA